MPRHIKDQNIVLVEDDAAICQSLNDFFSGRNTLQIFSSAEEALGAQGQFTDVDVFILDYKLPGRDGIELFKHLRGQFPAAKYLLITGEMSYEMAESTRTLGLTALMLKPCDVIFL